MDEDPKLRSTTVILDGLPNLHLYNVILDVQITQFGPKSLYEVSRLTDRPTDRPTTRLLEMLGAAKNYEIRTSAVPKRDNHFLQIL